MLAEATAHILRYVAVLLAGLCGWVRLLAGLYIQAELLGGPPHTVGLLAVPVVRWGRQLDSATTSGGVRWQAVLPGNMVLQLGLHEWEGLWPGLCGCSWLGGVSGCAS